MTVTTHHMTDLHGGLSCEAAEEDRQGLGYGYADFRDRVFELEAENTDLKRSLDIYRAGYERMLRMVRDINRKTNTVSDYIESVIGTTDATRAAMAEVEQGLETAGIVIQSMREHLP